MRCGPPTTAAIGFENSNVSYLFFFQVPPLILFTRFSFDICLSVCLSVPVLLLILGFFSHVRPSVDLIVILYYFDHGCELFFFIYVCALDLRISARLPLYLSYCIWFFFNHVEGYVCCFFLFMTSRFWFGFYGCVQYGMITRILLFFLYISGWVTCYFFRFLV